jgi:hypothetical protein
MEMLAEACATRETGLVLNLLRILFPMRVAIGALVLLTILIVLLWVLAANSTTVPGD